jgi:ABC-type uncharacterized transport system substrate-binding protein
MSNQLLQHFFSAISLALLIIQSVFFSNHLEAKEASVYIAHSGVNQADRQLLTQLVDQLQKSKPVGYTIKQLNTQLSTVAQIESTISNPKSCVISIGHQALSKVLATRQQTPIFSILVSRIKLDTYINNYQRFNVPLTGIYHEQSFQRQLMLAKAIKPKLHKVGTLLGNQSRYSLSSYLNLAKRHNLMLSYYILKHHAPVQNYFERMPIEQGFLLILNDHEQFSTTDLQSLMLVSNNRKIPMIGAKSSDSIFAALASVYTNNEQLAVQAAEGASKHCTGTSIQNAVYAEKYVVDINPHVAEILGYKILDQEQLLESIKSQEDALNDE